MKSKTHSTKPFNSCELVGMSMGARKRKARAVTYLVIEDVTFFDQALQWAKPLHAKLFRQKGFPRHAQDTQHYTAVRDRYRIGQRLRPCLGCLQCQSHKLWVCERCGTVKTSEVLFLPEVRCRCGRGEGCWSVRFPAKKMCNGCGVLSV